MENRLLGIFPYVENLLDATEAMKGAGYSTTVISPVPLVHEMEHQMGETKDNVRYFTIFGGVNGFILGTAFALGTAALYILPRGGRPIFAMTPTLVISYETTILLGVLMTLFGFFVLNLLPFMNRRKVYDPGAEVDTFGLLVEGIREDKFKDVERMLLEHGASEVKRVEGY